MTRKEQIKCASIEYTLKNRPMCIGGVKQFRNTEQPKGGEK